MTYDYLIVGGGSAGAVLADRLSADGSARVGLVEAGPDYRSSQVPEAMRGPNPHRVVTEAAYSPYRWDALQARRTKAQSPRRYWAGKGVGGSSSINGQIAIRGVPEDFDGWAAAGCRGWSFADVLPAFRRLEHDLKFGAREYHGDGGPIPIYRAPVHRWGAVDGAFAQAALESGHPWAEDHNAPGATGLSPYAINSRDGVRVSTNEAYLEGARDRENLTIHGDAHVDKVLFEGDRAIGVRVRIAQIWGELHSRVVILCAGSLHSPAILLRSGVGPRADLRALGIETRADLPVGASLQDHPAMFMPIALRDDCVSLDGERHTNACVRYDSGLGGAGPNDMMMVALNGFGDSLAIHTKGEGRPQRPGLVGVWVNQCFSRGTLRLVSANPFDAPEIDLNLLDHPSDLARMRDGFRRLQALGASPSIRDIGTVDAGFLEQRSDDEIDALLMKDAGDTQHPTSTCRMGADDDPAAVVDSECRVRGLEGLLVVDASVMPSVVRANTHLTTVMIAERMCERLLGERRPPMKEAA